MRGRPAESVQDKTGLKTIDWVAWTLIFIVGVIRITAVFGPWHEEDYYGEEVFRDEPSVATTAWFFICLAAAFVVREGLNHRGQRPRIGRGVAPVFGADSALPSPPARRLDRLPPSLPGQSWRPTVSVAFLLAGPVVAGAAFILFPDIAWWIVGGCVVTLLLTLSLYLRGSRRVEVDRASYVRWAKARGWAYHRAFPRLSDVWAASPFGRSAVRSLVSVVTGAIDGRFAGAGVYSTERIEDAETSQRNLSVAFVRVDRRLPAVDIVPRDLADDIDVVFGGADIRVESADFNARWRVMSERPDYAHAVVHPRLMERLLADDAAGYHLRIEGETVVIWSHGLSGVHDLDTRLLLAADIAQLVPAHVLQKHGDEARAALFEAPGIPTSSSTAEHPRGFVALFTLATLSLLAILPVLIIGNTSLGAGLRVDLLVTAFAGGFLFFFGLLLWAKRRTRRPRGLRPGEHIGEGFLARTAPSDPAPPPFPLEPRQDADPLF